MDKKGEGESHSLVVIIAVIAAIIAIFIILKMTMCLTFNSWPFGGC